ncbi:n-alkane-inducible cytochrome P450 [Karstenula rhodostoma CBS 690.94]|uniref:N-alkane-inducible cytochrome P450 n=1 Tax=Karstenula rhodostoma CBS 690.94 TaxID=1392251 RepID=A0A9P4PKZ8_9PLEO|nr:n-alkane-inducible cytochrome P450 [Karstenula rhodostoma CBS 690.94]
MSFEILSTPRAQALALLLLVVVLIKTSQSILKSRRRRQFARQHGCEPVKARYPHKFPYLGMDRIRESRQARKEHRVIGWIHQKLREAGSYTQSFRIFNKTIILTSEPANIKAVFATNFNDFDTGGRLDFVGQVIGKGIFTTDGEEWKHSRAMIRPNFARAQVANIDTIEIYLQDMFKLLPSDGTSVDLQPLFFSLTIDTSTEFLFGESVHSLRGDEPGKPSGVAFTHAYDTALQDAALRAMQSPLARLMGQSKQDKQNCKTVHDFVQRYVDEALRWRQTWDGKEKALPTGQYTFLYELVKETTDPIVLRGEVLNLLLAGRDTTASLLGSMFFQLAKRPDVWERLRAEIAELNGAKPSFEELKNMKLLQFCMKETLRVNTIVPAVIRDANKDTTLPVGGGKDGKSPILLKKGQMVFCQPAVMHLREDLWGPDAGVWNPDRWATLRPGAWDYIPFLGGPRVCIGQQYALTEAGYVTARMVQTFSKMASRDEGPWQEKLTLTCASKQTNVSLTRA